MPDIIANHLQPLPTECGERLRFALVYVRDSQAYVFKVDCFNLAPFGRNARCEFTARDFRQCEAVAYGAGLAGAVVQSMHCDSLGDVASATWQDVDTVDNADNPYDSLYHPVFFTIGL